MPASARHPGAVSALQPAQARSTNVQSVQRAVALLKAVAGSGVGATAPELARACGLTRATAWRFLKTLEDTGMVVMDRPSGRYRVGPAAAEIGSAAGDTALIELARPLLAEGAADSGETASLALLGLGGLSYVAEVAAPSVIAASWLGRVVPLHATSTGKALLAWLPRAEAEYLLADGLRRYTSTTITSPDVLEDGLEQVRRMGYATCRGEFEESLYGVSAPVLDAHSRPRAIISLWGPNGRLSPDRFPELGTIVTGLAARLGRTLGSGQPAPA